ncbi:MAG: tetratricopeptide repeat protein, partial [Spirochaetota bacterium]
DYKEAERLFLKYSHSAAQPGLKERGLFMLGKSLSSTKKYAEAAMAFQNIYLDYPQSDFADKSLFEHAGILVLLDRLDESVAEFKALLEKYPASSLAEEGMYKRGELLYSDKKFGAAKDAFYEYRITFPKGKLRDAALYWGGMAALNIGEKFGAVLLWERLIDEHRDSSYRSDAIKRTAEIHAENGDFRKALQLYAELIAVYPEDAAVAKADLKAEKIRYLLLGQTEREAELSVIINEKKRAETAEGRQAMIELARIYIYKGGTSQDLGAVMLDEVIKRQSVDPASGSKAHYLLGDYFYRKGNLSKAGNEYLDAAVTNPADKDLTAASLYRAAEITMLAGNIEEAKNLVGRIEKNFPDSQWAAEGRKLLEGTK